MKYLARIIKTKVGFKKDKVYKVVQDFYDMHSQNWYEIQNENGDKTLIHKNYLEILGLQGLNGGDKDETLYLS